MIMKASLFPLFLCVGLLTTSWPEDARPKVQDFLIDPSKHYVYLKFDHVGERKPLLAEETNKGLWLRLVDNCRVPIAVAIFNSENADHSVGVYDEVVSSITMGPLPIVHFPRPPQSRTTPAVASKEAIPQGYTPPDTFSTTTISPGESLLFNLPLNHVGPSWGLEIRFYFELPGESYGTGPYSVVSFDWQDIPEKFRTPGPAQVSPKPTTH